MYGVHHTRSGYTVGFHFQIVLGKTGFSTVDVNANFLFTFHPQSDLNPIKNILSFNLAQKFSQTMRHAMTFAPMATEIQFSCECERDRGWRVPRGACASKRQTSHKESISKTRRTSEVLCTVQRYSGTNTISNIVIHFL